MDPLELIYDSQDTIPEAFRDLYSEKDGAWQLTGVNGLKTQADVDQVKEALRKEREDHDKVRDALKPWRDLKPDEVMSQLDRIKELEAAAGGKLDEDKLNELVEGRLSQKTGPLERSIQTLTEERDTFKTENETLKGTIEARDRNDSVRSVASESKAHGTATPDIEMAASAMLEKDESGKWVTKSGIDDLTPGLDVKGWMKEMQKLRPHWWPESEGGGALGGGGGGNFGGANPWSADNWNMTEQGKILQSQGAEVAGRMAKAAGTTVGGMKPVKK